MRTSPATGALGALLLASTLGAAAGPQRRAAAPGGDLTIRFGVLDGAAEAAPGDALLPLGALSARREAGGVHAARAARRVTVTVEGGTAPFARLSCFLTTDDGRARIRVDGLPLGAVPRVVDPHARVGAASVHVVEVEVPGSSAPGTLLSSINWLAETD